MAAAILYEASSPGVFILTALALLGCIGIVGLTWMVRVILAMRYRRWNYRYLVVPAIGVLTFTLVVFDVPFQARWAHAKPALEGAATDALAGRLPLHEDLRAGTFDVSPEVRGGTVRFLVRNAGGFMDTRYFVYAPDGSTPQAYGEHPDRDSVQHIGGPWWNVMEVF
ncbi:hypothetical protein CQY22_013410 [Mycolicibacterium brumae]|uniref:Uncharacterized protein n=1 Tax=Mycolicibacterium brumae TaxID=85968 RepID=A0A2G5P7W7_9MYCO|nr:hypothetical protein CQY22_013410 [Mycolicibacterium brumae]RWA22679.1 hypothetical protein MBRU_12065 [Mycolicibacterium brumae DSM 44177]